MPGTGEWKVGSHVVFAIAACVVFAAYVHRIEAHPAYVDYDSATLGIFVNDLSFHERFDLTFHSSGVFQDRYRRAWAAAALPLSLPLSLVQRGLGIPPVRVGTLVRAAGLALAFLGALAAALALCRRRNSRATDVLFVAGLTTTFPPFLLLARTGFPNVMLPFLVFWTAILLTVRWAESGRGVWLHLLAVALAVGALQPYPPLLALPVILVAIVVVHGRVRATMRSPHPYVAVALGFGLTLAASFAIGTLVVGSRETHRAEVRVFQDLRSGAVSPRAALAAPLTAKVRKLASHHLWFAPDPLGDRSRDETPWTLGHVHVGWLALVPIGLLGLAGLTRRSDTALRIAGVVLAGCLVLFLTIVLPEGRYAVVLVPCYAFLVLRGFDRLVSSAAARRAVLGATLLVFAVETYARVAGDYDRAMDAAWRSVAPMTEAMRLIGRPADGEHWQMALPMGPTYKPELYFRMLANGEIEWVGIMALLARLAPSVRVERAERLLVVWRDEEGTDELWIGRGFQPLHRWDAGSGAGRFVLFERRLVP